MKRKSTNGNNVGVKVRKVDDVRSSINLIVETNAALSAIPVTSCPIATRAVTVSRFMFFFFSPAAVSIELLCAFNATFENVPRVGQDIEFRRLIVELILSQLAYFADPSAVTLLLHESQALSLSSSVFVQEDRKALPSSALLRRINVLCVQRHLKELALAGRGYRLSSHVYVCHLRGGDSCGGGVGETEACGANVSREAFGVADGAHGAAGRDSRPSRLKIQNSRLKTQGLRPPMTQDLRRLETIKIQDLRFKTQGLRPPMTQDLRRLETIKTQDSRLKIQNSRLKIQDSRLKTSYDSSLS
ncbi:hypothetical protein WH47_05377 [Habropoda laboriosa]|uniref:Uncharacterized protein n=1 Tax=Habropoda laboriosa TaxID=597456 RepID=A0A0L7RJY3_9HYME|nr:hypothetical protein WH47_05377 [Habropoda laboriosa]